MKKYRGYYSCPIRGAKGAAATIEDCQRNCDIARKNLAWLEECIPDVEWVAPAVHDRIVQRLLEKQYVTIEQVLECDGIEQAACDFTVVHKWEASGGVDHEVAYAQQIGQLWISVGEHSSLSTHACLTANEIHLTLKTIDQRRANATA